MQEKLLLHGLILTNFIKLSFISAVTLGDLNDIETEYFLHKEIAFLFKNVGLFLMHEYVPCSCKKWVL